MEIRKVQLTGGKSYVITLPKDWIRKWDIKKNEPLEMIPQSDGSLLITSKATEARPHREREITTKQDDVPEHLIRILLGSYIMGYSTITVRTLGRFQPAGREAVASFARMTIGPEIIEEGPSHISIKDLLNPVEMPFDKTIRRMHAIVRSMHEDAMNALDRRNRPLAEDVLKRDGSVDRLHWLIARQANMVLSDATLSRKLGVSPEEANNYSTISRILERVGDHGVKIAGHVIRLIGLKPDKGIQSKMMEAGAESLKLLQNSIDSWFKKDIRAANQDIDSLTKLVEQCNVINSDAKNIKSAYSIHITDIAESMQRTGEYATDISEIVINNFMLNDGPLHE